jgi:hypothetical protein
MALSYPLTMAQLFDILEPVSVSFSLSETLTHNRTRGGDILVADIGTRLWNGQIEFGFDYMRQVRALEAKLALLRGAGASFLFSDPSYNGPAYDPDGVILGASTPQIASLDANNRELAIKGLPSGYTFTAGDYVSFTNGSPTQYCFHQIVVGSTASGGGTTGLMEVVPNILPGAAVNDSITVYKPSFKAVNVPGGFTTSKQRGIGASGASFSFTQTLR